MLELIGDVGFIAAAMGAITFFVTYTFAAKWWRGPGRYVMTFAGVLTAIMVLGLVRLIFGPYPGIWLIRPIAFGSLAIVIWGAVIALIRVQIAKRTRANEDV